MKDQYSKELTEISRKSKRFKPWYEVASGKSLLEISNENNEHEYYFFAYDLMSNWVHPQSVDDNINLEYEQSISVHNEKILYLNLLICLTSLEDNILLILKYFKISESNPMFEISELLSELKIIIRDKYFDLDNKGCVSK